MAEGKRKELACGTMLRSALLAWLLSALLCLLIAAAAVDRGLIPYRGGGYLGSGISFLTAVSAGAAMGKATRGGLLRALAASICMVILLLTLGFLISRAGLAPAGILSVASFTIAGFVCGSLLFGGKGSRGRSGVYPIKRK